MELKCLPSTISWDWAPLYSAFLYFFPPKMRNSTFAPTSVILFPSVVLRRHKTGQRLPSICGFNVLTSCDLWTLLVRNNKDSSRASESSVWSDSLGSLLEISRHTYIYTHVHIYTHTRTHRKKYFKWFLGFIMNTFIFLLSCVVISRDQNSFTVAQ